MTNEIIALKKSMMGTDSEESSCSMEDIRRESFFFVSFPTSETAPKELADIGLIKLL